MVLLLLNLGLVAVLQRLLHLLGGALQFGLSTLVILLSPLARLRTLPQAACA